MTVYIPVQSEAANLDKLFKDDPTTVELALCDSAAWSNPPTETEIVSSIIAATQGYTHQSVTPTAGAATSSNVATLTFASANMSVTSGTLNYTGACIVIDQGLASEKWHGPKNLTALARWILRVTRILSATLPVMRVPWLANG